jgi:cobalamin biosynthesis protein CobT
MKADISFLPPDDPDMDRPSVTGREFEDGTRTAVRTMSSQFDTQVVFAGNQACTNGKMVMLPAQAPDAILTKRQAHVGRGFANHEALHNLLTDFGGSAQRRQEWQRTGRQFTEHMSQAIEDVRIENGGAYLYPGMAKSIDKTAEFVCRRFVEKTFVDNPEVADDPWAILPLAVTWAGRLRIGYPSPVIKAAFDRLGADVRRRAEQIVDVVMAIPHGVTGVGSVDRALAYDGCRQGLDLAERVANELAKEKQEEEEEQRRKGGGKGQGSGDGQGQGQGGGAPGQGQGDGQGNGAGGQGQGAGDGQGQGQSGNGGSGGNGASGSDGTHTSADNSPQASGQDANGGGGGHGAASGTTAEQGHAVEARSVDPNLDPLVNDLLTSGVDSSDAYRPFTRSADQWETRKGDGRLADSANNHGNEQYAKHKATITSSLATMRRKLERALIAKENRMWEVSRTGRLDVRRRGVNIMLGNELIYKKRSDGDDINAAVQVLVDLSGSMDGDKVQVATQACIGIAEALSSTTVPLEIIGHHTESIYRREDLYGQLVKQLNDNMIGEDGSYVLDADGNCLPNPNKGKFDRHDAVRMYEFKHFDQNMTQARPALGVMPWMTAGANADADAIMYAAHRLLARDEDRKIMLVMADGFPAWNSCGGKEANYRRTRDAVQWCESKGIKMVGIGIQSEAVKRFFPRYVVLQSVDGLGKTVLDEIARLILGERFRVDNKDLLATDRNRARAMAR